MFNHGSLPGDLGPPGQKNVELVSGAPTGKILDTNI